MNIDIVGRVRPAIAGELLGGLIQDGNRISAQRGGASHNFNIVFQQDSPNSEIFAKTVQPLLDLFIAGFNTCILLYGESGSGKSFTMTGEQTGNAEPGIVPQAIGYITSTIQKQNEINPTQRSSGNPQMSARAFEDRGRVLLYHYEMYNENIRDLMTSRGGVTTRGYQGPLEIKSTAQRGTFIKNLQYEICRNPNEAISAYWQAWQSRSHSSNEGGPAKNSAAYIMQLELFMMTDENPLPNRSVFSVIRLPGVERLGEGITRNQLQQGANVSRSISAFNKLTADLARQPDPSRIIGYNDSKLTSIMEEILGGNCKTRVICCLSPSTSSRPDVLATVLNGCGLLAQVKNYPIINDCLAQDLMTQYRTRGSLPHGGADAADAGLLSKSELQDQLLKLTGDNTQLRERNDRLFQRMEQSQDKMTDVARSKGELSAKLVMSEEEKLRISKGMIELQLQNNRLTEEFEAENFDLKSKILSLENQLVEFELEKNKFARNHDISAEHARHLEENRRKIADDFVALKQKAEDQDKELESQRKLNNEMRLELAKLIETEAALLDLRDNVEKRRQIHDDAGRELEEARKVLREASVPIPHGNTSRAAEGLNALEQLRSRRAEIHRQTLDRQRSILKSSRGDAPEDEMKTEALARVRRVFDEQTRELESRLLELKNQVQIAYAGIQAATRKHAEQTTEIEKIKEEHKRFKEENTRLQTELKEANEDYRRRLWKYVQDIANFVDNGSKNKENGKNRNGKSSARDPMKRQVEEMFKEMKSAFRLTRRAVDKSSSQLQETI